MSGDKSTRNRKRCWNNTTKQKCVEAGVSGLFMTCDNNEKQAIAEAYNIIDYLMEDAQSAPIQNVVDSDEVEGEDVADSLKRICAEVREHRNKVRRCKQRPTGVKNCLFITVRDADVVDLAERMVAYAQSSRQCRYLQRVLPVEETAEVSLKKLSEMILKCVSRHLKPREDGSVPSYSLEFRARNNGSVKKADVLEMLGEAVNSIAPAAKVDLSGADVTIMVHLLRKTLMVGAVPNFYGKRKYTMRPMERSDETEESQKAVAVKND